VCASVRHIAIKLAESRPEEWLLIEWPEGEEAPTKYWLSTLPSNIGFRQFIDMVKLAGALSATTTTSNRKLAVVISRGGVARLSPSRNTVHRRLRIPGLGAGNDFPLRSSLKSCYSRKLSAEGIRHCGLNGTFQIRLRPSEED
jgi:hypothetical protein